MNKDEYRNLKNKVIDAGYAEEIKTISNLGDPEDAWSFFCDYSFVVCNTGMKNQVGEKIAKKIRDALKSGGRIGDVFRHAGKVRAMEEVYNNRYSLYKEYLNAKDKLLFIETLPFIGKVNKFHLARNWGMDVCKPDRHLMRIAKGYGTTPESMCKKLSQETGDKIGVVDVVIWRAANLGFI